MTIVQLPCSFVNLISPLAIVFTNPSFKYFKAILSGFLLNPRKKTISGALRISRIRGHFSNAYRFLKKYVWDIQELSHRILLLIVDKLSINEPLLFAIDDVLKPKFGPKIYGRALHFNHSTDPNEPPYIQGHNWVVCGLVYWSKLFAKWVCFPLRAILYVPKKEQQKGTSYESRIDIAISIIKNIQSVLKRSFILVADAAYAKTRLIRFCILTGITFISRLRSDAALYSKLDQNDNAKKGRGRPRKYGKRLPPLSELAKDICSFKRLTVNLYGKERKVWVKALTAVWKPAGALIKVLMVYYPKKSGPNFFFSTDLSLEPEQMLRIIAGRWSIENAFKDLKTHLGFGEDQCRDRNAIERYNNISCHSLSLLTLWSLLEASSREPELFDVPPWNSNKAVPSILDMLFQLKNKAITQCIFRNLEPWGINAKNIKPLTAALGRIS